MNDTRLERFKAELKELLKKYDANIDYHLEGDTHGIYNDYLGVQFLEPLKKGDNFRQWTKLYPLTKF